MIVRPTITEPWSVAARIFSLGVAAFVGIISVTGCRSAAYRDVYQRKMAGEIRVLEDRLYDADYQNEVLRDRLTRAEAKAAQVVIPHPGENRTRFGPPQRVDRGEFDAETNTDAMAAPPSLPARPFPPEESSRPARELPAGPSLTPPDSPMPPGREDILLPDVDLGVPVPPPADGDPADAPPGQIRLPDSAKRLGPRAIAVPVAIRVNQALSGGHRFEPSASAEEGAKGVYLVVEVIDEQGDVVSMDTLEPEGPLEVVLLDPLQSPAEARLGKWVYSADELRDMVRSGPQAGIHLAVETSERSATGKTIIAHVRLTVGEVLLQTECELPTSEPNLAGWNPRGTVTRR